LLKVAVNPVYTMVQERQTPAYRWIKLLVPKGDISVTVAQGYRNLNLIPTCMPGASGGAANDANVN
jgi:hypothetical protein